MKLYVGVSDENEAQKIQDLVERSGKLLGEVVVDVVEKQRRRMVSIGDGFQSLAF